MAHEIIEKLLYYANKHREKHLRARDRNNTSWVLYVDDYSSLAARQKLFDEANRTVIRTVLVTPDDYRHISAGASRLPGENVMITLYPDDDCVRKKEKALSCMLGPTEIDDPKYDEYRITISIRKSVLIEEIIGTRNRQDSGTMSIYYAVDVIAANRFMESLFQTGEVDVSSLIRAQPEMPISSATLEIPGESLPPSGMDMDLS
jgi:hypothetical protein